MSHRWWCRANYKAAGKGYDRNSGIMALKTLSLNDFEKCSSTLGKGKEIVGIYWSKIHSHTKCSSGRQEISFALSFSEKTMCLFHWYISITLPIFH